MHHMYYASVLYFHTSVSMTEFVKSFICFQITFYDVSKWNLLRKMLSKYRDARNNDLSKGTLG